MTEPSSEFEVNVVILKKPLGVRLEQTDGEVRIVAVRRESEGGGGALTWNQKAKSPSQHVLPGDRFIAYFLNGDRIDVENKSQDEIVSLIAGHPDSAISIELRRRRRKAEQAAERFQVELSKPLGLVIGAGKGQVLILQVEQGGNADKWNQGAEAKASDRLRSIQARDHVLAYYQNGKRVDISSESYANVLSHVKQHEGATMTLELEHCIHGDACAFNTSQPPSSSSSSSSPSRKRSSVGESIAPYLDSVKKVISNTTNLVKEKFVAQGYRPDNTFFVELTKPLGITIGAVGVRVIVTQVKDSGGAAVWNNEMAKAQQGKHFNISKQILPGDQLIAIWEDGKRCDFDMTYDNVVAYAQKARKDKPLVLQLIHLPPGLLRKPAEATRTLKGCGFRSVLWRSYLTVVPMDVNTEQFYATLQRQRAEYRRLRAEHPIMTPEEIAEMQKAYETDPLSINSNPRWVMYADKDEGLLTLLRKDISRTFSELSYFQQKDTQEMLERILFVWSKDQEPDSKISYQQGMHELLAVIIMVLIRDITAADEARAQNGTAGKAPPVLPKVQADAEEAADSKEASKDEAKDGEEKADEPLEEATDTAAAEEKPSSAKPKQGARGEKVQVTWADSLRLEHLEADAYTMFSHLMNTLLPFYTGASFVPGKTDATQPFLYFKVQQIHFNLLARYDPELFAHLEAALVLPHLYLMRWVRLLFTREFTIEQSFMIWDCLLKSKGLELVDYICVAMLAYIRETLLAMQTSHCLTKVFHYPSLNNRQVQEVLSLALGLYEGRIFNFADRRQFSIGTFFKGASKSFTDLFSKTKNALS